MIAYIDIKVVEKIYNTESTVTLVLEPSQPFHYRAGQFLTFIFPNLGIEPIRRSYSFSSAPSSDALPTITVKKVANSLASRYLVDQIQVGDRLQALPPLGRFTLPTYQRSRTIFLIGGGSGITPLFSILKDALLTEPESKIVLLYANRNESSTIFKEELLKLNQRYGDRLRCIFFFSEMGNYQSNHNRGIEVYQGHISNDFIEQTINKYLEFDRAMAQFFICGPKGLMLKAKMTIGFMKFAKEQIHQEIFVIQKPSKPNAKDLIDAKVTVLYKEETHLINVKAGETILESASKADIELPYNCNSGSCTACSGKCTSGIVKMYAYNGVLDTNTTKGLALTCVGYPQTETVIIDLNQ